MKINDTVILKIKEQNERNESLKQDIQDLIKIIVRDSKDIDYHNIQNLQKLIPILNDNVNKLAKDIEIALMIQWTHQQMRDKE